MIGRLAADRIADGWTAERWLWRWFDIRAKLRPTTRFRFTCDG
ncbi:hypothetical protein [Micromonospora antibiotica]|nr:hypothetical protein [Micromonospora antibiotica]